MGTTPGGIPYPESTDVPDVPYWMQQQAEAIDTALRPKIQAGLASLTLSASSQATLAVVFTTPFPEGTVPVVVASYASSAFSPPLIAGASNVTRTGFTLALSHAAGTSGTWTRQASWIAVLVS
jgi:hypothetical protein